MKIVFYATLIFCGVICLTSATKNDKKSKKLTQKVLNENYVFVPSGKVIVYKDTLSIQSFIMFKTEVSNANYREFLSDLKLKGKLKEFAIANIDSLLWRTPLNFGAKYVDYYHMHPAYRDYPVVNITKEGAELYCEWLSERINSSLGNNANLMFRLPTHEEWMYAAHGDLESSIYPWGGPYLRNSSGEVLCNFLRLDATSIGRDSLGKYTIYPTPGDMMQDMGVDVIAPVKSYWTNGFGIYNMSGNVAEIVADKSIVVGGSWLDPGYDVRIESQKPYVGAARNIGFRVVATVVPSEYEWLKVPKNKK